MMKLHNTDLNKGKEAVHMKTISIAVLTEVFPDYLAVKEGPLGSPPDFHPKDAPACVLTNTNGRMEQDEEFSGFMVDLLAPHHDMKPKQMAQTSISKHCKNSKESKIQWPHTLVLGSIVSH